LHAENPETGNRLLLSCAPENDLFEALTAAGYAPARHNTPEQAINAAPPGGAVLILADRYPAERTDLPPALFEDAAAKEVRLYIEYPANVPNITFGRPRGVRWERAVVASDGGELGLPRLGILSMHDCQFLPTKVADPLVVVARVAGLDKAIYGLPEEQYPILFRADDRTFVATTKLSDFVTSRYAPAADWLTLWTRLLDHLHPRGAPHRLSAKPAVAAAYGKDQPLPENAELLAVDRLAGWYMNSRLLVTPKRARELDVLIAEGQEVTPPPSEADAGDGSLGILEGYASQIRPDGSQLQRTPIRADCQAESAAALAFHAALRNDARSRQTAVNLLNYLYFKSELHQRERGNPAHPAYGLIAWGALSPAWRVANYGDDNARTLLATMAAAACLGSDAWDAPMLKAMYANLRTTGTLGFRGERIDMPALEARGWRAFQDQETIHHSPFFESYLWACYLWTYARTGDEEFLSKAKSGIRRTMDVYPDGWRWGDNLDRSRMLLALAWLVRVEDSPQHREWLHTVAGDLLARQHVSGAVADRLPSATSGHYVRPASNEAYGQSETPLIQDNGDLITDQLYTSSFLLFGLREAVAATSDARLKAAEDKLAAYLVRIQVRSEAVPYLDGTWFRAFDFGRWDYWSSSGDLGWGAWCAETGWGPAWSGIALGLRLRQTSLWDLTGSSKIASKREEVKRLLAQNDGGPWRPAK
jgi:hypothetical protein